MGTAWPESRWAPGATMPSGWLVTLFWSDESSGVPCAAIRDRRSVTSRTLMRSAWWRPLSENCLHARLCGNGFAQRVLIGHLGKGVDLVVDPGGGTAEFLSEKLCHPRSHLNAGFCV